MEWDTLKERMAVLKAAHAQVQNNVARTEALCESAVHELDTLVTCQALIQEVAQTVQQQLHERISAVVTQCLEIVFGETAYTFQIKWEQKRGKTEAVLVLCRDGMELDPLASAGGGVVDVAAFALRIATLGLTRPRLRRVVMFDEPFRFVSRNYWPNLTQLIRYLGTKLEVQFIIVTHCPELRCGQVIELE